jgi:CheY-like chemotaxis protein
MAGKRVLSIGQCAADHAAISRVLERAFGAEVIAAESGESAVLELERQGFDLVLVNRLLDGDSTPGIEVIRQLQHRPCSGPPVMLVSNLDDAQAEAVQVGATPGFGKASLGQPGMLARVKPFLD